MAMTLVTEDQLDNIFSILSNRFYHFDPGPKECRRMYGLLRNCEARHVWAVVMRMLTYPPIFQSSISTDELLNGVIKEAQLEQDRLKFEEQMRLNNSVEQCPLLPDKAATQMGALSLIAK